MATPISNLEAIRGTDFSEIITLADDSGAPVSTNNATGLFVLRYIQNGPVIKELTNSSGISFGTSNVEIRLTEQELDDLVYNKFWFDFFIHLQNDVKRKIVRGNFTIE